MCEPMTLMMAASAVGGGLSAFGTWRQGQIEKKVAENNAVMAERAADDAIRRGEQEAQQVQRQTAALKANQRVGMAAHGLDLSYGTAQDIQDQTDFFGQSDVATTRQNAFNEAWNQRENAKQLRYQGKAAAQQANLAAVGSLLTTGSQVASKWSPTGTQQPGSGQVSSSSTGFKRTPSRSGYGF